MSIYGLLIGIAFIIGINYFEKNNQVVPKDKTNLFIILLAVSSIIGARLYHVVDNWSYYSQNHVQILNTRAGGLGIYGGILGALIFIFLFSTVYRLSFLKILDYISPIMPICQSLGRWGNFVNHEAYSPTGLPVWLFESILCLGLFFIIKKFKTTINPTGLYLVGYGTIRFFLEFLRNDTWVISNLKVAQLISILFILIGLILLLKHKDFTIQK